MFKKVNIFFPLSLLTFFVIQLILVSSGLFQIGIFFYILYVFILFSVDKKYVISLFVYHVPLLPIISTEHKLFSVLGPEEIIYGTSFLVLLYIKKKYLKKNILNKYQTLSISFIYFLFFISFYIMIKDISLGLEPDKTKGAFYIFKNFIRYFLYYVSLILLVKIIYLKGLYEYITVGFKYSVVTITLSMIFTRELLNMGAGIAQKADHMAKLLSGEYQRYLGFYGAGGDENSVGIFLVAAFAFFLAMFERTGNLKKYIVFMGFAVLGSFLTGSRTAFLALAIVLLIFLITNKSGYVKFIFLIIGIIFYFVFTKQIELVIQRFLDPSAIKAIDPNEEGRVGKWIIYFNWIMNHLETLLFGNLQNITYNRAPHNYFIYIIYHTGIIIFIVFMKLFYKLIKLAKFRLTASTLKNVYYIIPFPFALMTVNSFGSSIHLWLYLPIGAYFILNNEHNKSKKQFS